MFADAGPSPTSRAPRKMRGLSSDAARDPAIPADIRDTFETIEKHVLQEARLIDDLLDVTRIGTGKLNLRLESLELDRVVEEAVEIIRPRGQEKQQETMALIRSLAVRALQTCIPVRRYRWL